MRWLGTACFEIGLSSGKTIVLDPYLDDAYTSPIGSDQIESCDYIFITHGHFDHVTDVGKLATRFSPKIFCSDTTAQALITHQGVEPERFQIIRVGDRIEEADLAATVVEGVHVDLTKLSLPSKEKPVVRVTKTDFPFEKMGEWMKNYPGGEQLNFVFDPIGGKRIYVAGSFPDPKLLPVAQKVDAEITLMQLMSGNLLAGIEEQTLRMADASGCRILIPQHHDPLTPYSPPTDLSRFKQMVRDQTNMEFMELVPGEWYEF